MQNVHLADHDGPPTIGRTGNGALPMSMLQNCEIEQLSRLLARGSMSNAEEISRLLKVELNEQTDARTGKTLRSQFTLFCASLLRK